MMGLNCTRLWGLLNSTRGLNCTKTVLHQGSILHENKKIRKIKTEKKERKFLSIKQLLTECKGNSESKNQNKKTTNIIYY